MEFYHQLFDLDHFDHGNPAQSWIFYLKIMKSYIEFDSYIIIYVHCVTISVNCYIRTFNYIFSLQLLCCMLYSDYSRIRKLPVNFVSEHAQCQSAFQALDLTLSTETVRQLQSFCQITALP